MTIEQCPPHDFKYSHVEYAPAGIYASIPPNKDVIICSKCGILIKNNQI